MESPESLNPYAPPRAPLDVPAEERGLDAELASRWQRLGGSLFDALLRTIAIGPGYLGASSFAAIAQKGVRIKNPFFIYTNTGKWGVVAAVASAALLALQWSLLVKRGQTLGKIVAGTRVVKVDGTPADFVSMLVLRTWPVWVIEMLGAMTSVIALVGTVDLLFVFRKDRRCVHDLIAGTKVVRTNGG